MNLNHPAYFTLMMGLVLILHCWTPVITGGAAPMDDSRLSHGPAARGGLALAAGDRF